METIKLKFEPSSESGGSVGFFVFLRSVISGLEGNGQMRTAETYRSALNSFKKFRNGYDIPLGILTSDIIESYESWLKSREVTNNTISFYMRILRAGYNRAVEKEIIGDRKPFKHVYTGVEKTVKRALPISAIKKIGSLNFHEVPALDFARDMFMMSFMLRGMSFVDMAYLKKSDLQNGKVIYRRRKTNQRLTIKWTKEMEALLDKYPENESQYLLPIISRNGVNERAAYRKMGYRINCALKKIAERVGITIPLTLYVARHSWASCAHRKGIPIKVISEGLGHDSEKTTLIYLAGIDHSEIDKANSILIKELYG